MVMKISGVYPEILVETSGQSPALKSAISQLVTGDQLDSDEFHNWCGILKEKPSRHRKLWEFTYIMQALHDHGMLSPGKNGLGFGVGQEPLAAAMADSGCGIIASDLAAEDAREKGWIKTDQHASSLEQLNDRGICDSQLFRERVQFRPVDMNNLPPDLCHSRFDFIWSSCAFEHLGNLVLGLEFVKNSMHCLKPGGLAIHTTEYNLSSNDRTISSGSVVLYRRKDIEGLVHQLRADGHQVEFNPHTGSSEIDRHFDIPPYSHGELHLKLLTGGRFITTSVGLIVRKSDQSNS